MRRAPRIPKAGSMTVWSGKPCSPGGLTGAVVEGLGTAVEEGSTIVEVIVAVARKML